MTRRKKTTVALAGAGLLLGLLAVVMATSDRGQADAARSAVQPVAVEVTRVTEDSLAETVSAVGTVLAMRDVAVSSETAGRVTRVLVKVGDVVRAGQSLVTVDDELKRIAVDQARAQLLAAETSFRKAERDEQRAARLFETRDIADIELEGNRLALRSAEAQYKTAQVALRYAQRQLDDTRIKAPIGGTVASRHVEVGEMVGPGREIANIVDLSALRVKLSIPEEDIVRISVGQPAELRADSRPGETYRGSVYTVGAKSETPAGHSYPVEVLVDNRRAGPLRAGMFARVQILTRSAAGTLVISKESLAGEDARPQVFVVQNGAARLRDVRLGLRAGDRYQVVDGLRAGELVVSFGHRALRDGTPVTHGQQ